MNLNLIALIATRDNGDTILDVIEKTLHGHSKVVVMENSDSKEVYEKILEEYQSNEKVDVIKLDKPGKGNAIRNGLKHIKKLEYDLISTIDGDGETKPSYALKIAFETKQKQNEYSNIAFGKGCNYMNEGSIISSAGRFSKELLHKYTEMDKPDFKWDKIIDVRSGHHAITPEFADIINSNGIKSNGYGIEMELLKLAFDNKMYVPHFKVDIEPRRSRYAIQDVPLDELLDFIELFGRDFTMDVLKNEIGSNLVVKYREFFTSPGVYY